MKTRTMKTTSGLCFGLSLFACLAITTGGVEASPAKPERWGQRPQQQYLANSTSSWMARTTAPPSGTSLHVMEFDYMVDSEASWDYLKVWQNGVLLWSTSGARAGHQKLTLSSSSSTVKFEYVKDGSISIGRDTAMVDNVRFSADGVRYEWANFNGWAGAVPTGWTAGGTGLGASGFSTAIPLAKRSVARAAAQYHVNSSSSWMSRTVTFASATGSSVSFDYLVDSEQGFDFLKVWDGATLAFSASGIGKAGRAVIPITTAGSHTLKFEYVKDGSVHAGRDTARIANVEMRSGNQAFEIHDFAGLTLDAAPSGWTAGGTTAGNGMFVAKTTPHDSYVPRQTFLMDPTVDGWLGKAEYLNNPTIIGLRNDGSPTASTGQLLLAQSTTTNKLFIAAMLQATDVATGNENGTVTLYFDNDRGATLADLGCAGNVHSPSSLDRRITFNYSSAPGAEVATISSVSQVKGNCTGGYTALGADPSWPMVISVREPEGKGTLVLEMSVTIPANSPIYAENLLGFGFKRQSSGGTRIERFPYRDDAMLLPVDNDVYSLETIRLSSVPASGPAASENGWDGCCMSVEDSSASW